MKAKTEQKSGDGSQYAGYFQRLKHMTVQAFEKVFGQKNDKSDVIPSDTFIYVRGDESSHYHEERGPKDDRTREYPAYGMDIPGACKSLPLFLIRIVHSLFFSTQVCPVVSAIFSSVNFHRVMETLNASTSSPELFGIRELKQFIQHAKSYFDHVSKRYVCQLLDMKEQPDCSAEEASRENTDKKLLNKWNEILSDLPLSLERREEYSKDATRYGIGEIYQQANALEAIYPRKDMADFRRSIIEQYGEDDISMRKGREIIFTSEGLAGSPLTCEFLSQMKKCVSSVNESIQ